MAFIRKNEQINSAGHTVSVMHAKKAGKSSSPRVTDTGSIDFIEANKEEVGMSLARFRSSRDSKRRSNNSDEIVQEEPQKDFIEQIKKIPDIHEVNLKNLASEFLVSDRDLKSADIAASLNKHGFSDPSHVYLALRYAKDDVVKTINNYTFSQNIQAITLYQSRIEAIEVYIQSFMEKNNEVVFAGINSGAEQTEFSKLGLGTPQILRDYYRAVIKEHKSVMEIYKDIVSKHGIANFDTHCDFLKKFVSRHLEGIHGKYDSVKLQLMHNEIHLLRSVQSEINRVGDFFGSFDKKKSGIEFQHKVFEMVVSIAEAATVREAQIASLQSLCGVKEPLEKISVLNNLIACISDMPDMIFSNITARIKIRLMVINLCEKYQTSAGETLEELFKKNLYHKASGFKANAADPSLESLKKAAYFPELQQGKAMLDTISSQDLEAAVLESFAAPQA